MKSLAEALSGDYDEAYEPPDLYESAVEELAECLKLSDEKARRLAGAICDLVESKGGSVVIEVKK